MIRCTDCKADRSFDCFYLDKRYNSYQQPCRECKARRKKESRAKNPEKHKDYQKDYNEKHRYKINKYMRDYRKQNPEIIHNINQKQYHEKGGKEKKQKYDRDNLPKTRERDNKRYKNDPQFRIKKVLRSRISKFISEKSCHSNDLLDCDINFYIDYLEYQFDESMSWENYGVWWNIDHIFPCSSFDLTDVEQQKICYHWTNTRPLVKSENESKSDYIDKDAIDKHLLLLKQLSEENQLAIPNYSRKGIMAQISDLG